MSIFSSFARAAVATAFVALTASANASLVTYTSPTLFNAPLFQPGIDTFSSLPQAAIPTPYAGTAGRYSYVARTSGTGSLYGSGSAANPWLSTDLSGDTIVFSGFASGVRAIGGFFFGSDIAGAFLPGQSLTISAVDSFGSTAVQTLLNATETSFAGFISNGDIISMTVSIASLGAFATVNDLVIAQAPEPGMLALLFVGAGGIALGLGRGRSRRRVTAA